MSSLTPHQKKVLETDGHISLTANAGSGKTFILSKRYIETALNNNINLRNIAAITFTDRAAGELYQKISKEIDERIACARGTLLNNLQRIRRELVSANISTIHSFCISILKEFPIEAGVDADFTAVDENTSGELIDISIEEMVKTSLENEDKEDLKEMIRIMGSRFIFTQELKSLIRNYRTIVLLNRKIYSSGEEEIAEYLGAIFEQYREIILKDKKESILEALNLINNSVLQDKNACSIALEIKALLDNPVSTSTDSFLQYLALVKERMCTKSGTIYKQGYLTAAIREGINTSCEFIEDFFGSLDKFIRPENYKENEKTLASIGKKIVTFAEKAFLIYEDKKFERGCLDYEDILLKSFSILDNSDVRKELSEKFKFIMIDEYQDTNELQYRIFLPIVDYLKKGNLFIVGDEKQSIYMFRDADLAVFRKTKEDIEKESGRENLLILPDSFRMKKEICFFTNTVFKNLFASPEAVFNEVEHNDIICAKKDDGIPGRIEILLSGEEKDDRNTVTETELVTSTILQLQEKGEPFGNIAVLCRKRKSFTELEQAFSERGIPYNIVGGREFFQRQSIYDIYNYFSFLLSREDDTALVGVLRSPFFSLSDKEIYEISKEAGWTLWERLKAASANNEKLESIWSMLKENLGIAHSSDFISILRKIISETSFLAVLASRPDGVQECANIEKLISLTSSFSALGYKTLYDYVEFLKKSINEVDNEPQAVVSEGNDVVKIMTVHQSKGLEFNTVFLYNCSDKAQRTIVKSKSLTVDKEFGVITRFPPANNYFEEFCSAPLAGLFNYISAKKNNAELKRLFYVGVTRAKSNLFLSGEAAKKEKYHKDSFFGLLCSGLSDNLTSGQVQLSGNIGVLNPEDITAPGRSERISLNIPITRTRENGCSLSIDKFKEERTDKTGFLPGRISDEIISATKFSVYSQCPMKYYLLFEAGLKNLVDNNEIDTYDLRKTNPDSSFKKDTAGLRGRIIHKLLELSLPENELEANISNSLKNEEFVFTEKQRKEFCSEILNEVSNVYKSPFYKEISNAADSRNEYELTLKEKDFILFGRMDKVIFNEKSIRIVDYKTDNIKTGDIENHGKKYLYQLKFYSYILSRIFPGISEYLVTLLFTRYPGNPLIKTICRDELETTGMALEEMVRNLRIGNYPKNLHSCEKCSFFLNNKCLKDKI